MGIKIKAICVGVMAGMATVSVCHQARASEVVPLHRPVTQYSGNPITVAFNGTDIGSALRILAHLGKARISVDDSVRGSITAEFKAVPWDQALNIVLTTKGLKRQDKDGVLVVTG